MYPFKLLSQSYIFRRHVFLQPFYMSLHRIQGKKKQFIDKKKAVSFLLVHRSQRDPLQADEESSKHVLLPVDTTTAEVDCPDSNKVRIFICIVIVSCFFLDCLNQNACCHINITNTCQIFERTRMKWRPPPLILPLFPENSLYPMDFIYSESLYFINFLLIVYNMYICIHCTVGYIYTEPEGYLNNI